MKIDTQDRAEYLKLRKQFVSSYGYYLRQSADLKTLEALFLAGNNIDPHFTYENLSVKVLQARLVMLKRADQATATHLVRAKAFLHQRLIETELLLCQATSWETGQLPERFESLNEELFGGLDDEVFKRIVDTTQKGALSHFPVDENDYLSENILLLKKLIKPVSRRLLSLIEKPSITQAATLFLRRTGMYRRGWRVVEDQTRPSSLVAPRTRRLILGTSIVNTTDSKKKLAILLHELVHVVRAKYPSPHPESLNEQKELSAFEEGLAHAVERLSLDKTLIPARYWRYFAIGLSKGIDRGKPRTAREVYEILLPLYEKYAKGNDPKLFVFGTIVRVWKGTPFSVRGGAISKDIRYVHGSMLFVEALSRQRFTKRDFRFLLTHKVK